MKRCSLRLMGGFVISVILLFTGCAADGTPSPSPAAQSPIVQKQVPKTDSPSKWDTLVAAAKREGKVTIYGLVPDLLKAKLTRSFKDKYGIDTDVMAGRPPELAQKYFLERSANLNLADIFITGQSTTLNLIKPKGVLASPKPHLLLPEVLDLKAWPNGALPFLDKDELALALASGNIRFVAVNTELVKEGEIASYQDLLNPKWKGKIIMYDPSQPGGGSNWFALVMLKGSGKEAGEKYMRQLATQDPVVTRDQRLMVESTAKGKYLVCIGPDFGQLQGFRSAGAAIGYANTKEGGIVIAGGNVAALPDRPAHPAAASLMLNYLLSKEGQLVVSEGVGLPARRLDVPTTYAMPGTTLQPGEKAYWIDEDFILEEPSLWVLAKEIFGLQ